MRGRIRCSASLSVRRCISPSVCQFSCCFLQAIISVQRCNASKWHDEINKEKDSRILFSPVAFVLKEKTEKGRKVARRREKVCFLRFSQKTFSHPMNSNDDFILSVRASVLSFAPPLMCPSKHHYSSFRPSIRFVLFPFGNCVYSAEKTWVTDMIKQHSIHLLIYFLVGPS